MALIDLPVQGMTCRACEVRVTRAPREVPGVARATVSVRRGTARIHTDGPVPRRLLVSTVEAAGYRVAADDRAWLTHDRAVWRDVALAVAALGVLALALRVSGLTDLADRVGGLTATGSLGVVVLLGVAAGLSTCMALVGGLVLAVSASHAMAHPGASTARRLRPHVAFNVGRVVGFGLLGALVGALGSAVTLDGAALAGAMVVVALVMAAAGLRLTELSPRLSAAGGLTLPPRLSAALRLERADGRYSDARAALLGAGTFLLPCGFTQAVQVYALSTGSPVRAGLVMGLFALGTVPGLLGVGGLTASVSGTAATRVFRFAGVTVLAFAALNLSGALAVLAPGLGGPSAGPAAGAATALSDNVSLDGEVQVLRTTQVAAGYEPADATVYVGRPVRWEIDSTAVSCAASITAPELGLEPVILRPGVNTLTFTPTRTGTLHYTCAMGMYGGTVTVIDEPT